MDDKHATVKAQVPEGLAALATNGALHDEVLRLLSAPETSDDA